MQEEFQVPYQPSGRSTHPVQTPICPPFHMFGRRVLPSGPPRQISIIRLDEVFIPFGPHTVSRSFRTNLHPFGHFSSTSGRLSVLDQFLISFQVPRKGRSINRSDDVVSRSDARASKKEIADSTSTVRTTAYHGPDVRIADMEIGCRRIAVRTLIPHGPDALKPYKEITCSGRATVWTMCHPFRTKLLNRKDFLAKFLENLVA
jgi:hypothetical protein